MAYTYLITSVTEAVHSASISDKGGHDMPAEEARKQKIVKIVITGGPCAGKSTAMSWIQNAFGNLGYTVLFVPETATEFISGGVAPWTCGTNAEYQKVQMTLQREKERLFHQAAETMPGDKILIVCDRGELDNKAYMTDAEFKEVLDYLGTNEVALRDSYDAVFHLVTAARGAEDFYTFANNAARYETPQEAVTLDDRLLAAWTGHPHLRVIDNRSDFEGKMQYLIGCISTFLGESGPAIAKKKYLIGCPDPVWLESIPGCRKISVTLTYVKSTTDSEIRIRKRGEGRDFVYYKVERQYLENGQRLEVEQRLSRKEYMRLLKEKDPAMKQIRKTRYCFFIDGRSYEVDIYPGCREHAMALVPVMEPEAPVVFPEEMKVIREVTGVPGYRNADLAGGRGALR